MMARNRSNDLENAENWDFEKAEKREPAKRARVVVSVPFSREDFERVATKAEELGKRTSEFIREAALDKATGSSSESVVFLSVSPSVNSWTLQADQTFAPVVYGITRNPMGLVCTETECKTRGSDTIVPTESAATGSLPGEGGII